MTEAALCGMWVLGGSRFTAVVSGSVVSRVFEAALEKCRRKSSYSSDWVPGPSESARRRVGAGSSRDILKKARDRCSATSSRRGPIPGRQGTVMMGIGRQMLQTRDGEMGD